MLISIVVVTYNSAKYLEECLDSIKLQSYRDLELIVTDDCSIDDTIHIAKEWIQTNSSRFVSTLVIESPHNTGVAANCNRGLKYTKGEWVKFIAGDDLLADNNAIMEYVSNIPKGLLIGAMFSDVYHLHSGKQIQVGCKNKDIMFGKGVSAKDQYNILIKENWIPASSAFLCLSAIKNVGGFDESIPMCEDAVLWIKLTNHGYMLYYIDIPLVIYRIHSNSLVGLFHKTINIRLIETQIKVLDQYKIPAHKGYFRFHFKNLRQLLFTICNLSNSHLTAARVLMFLYRVGLHSVNWLYFLWLKIKTIHLFRCICI